MISTDFEKIFLKYVSENDVVEFYRVAELVKPGFFTFSGREAYDFITDHVGKYKKVPDAKLIEDVLKDKLDEPATQPIEFYVEVLKTRYLLKKTQGKINDIQEFISRGEADKAITVMEDYALDVKRDFIGVDKPPSIFDYASELEDDYNDIKAGILKGIASPWPSISKATMGYQPGDFILFAARSGKGKTFSLLKQADTAFHAGHKVLFITPEITQKRLLMRETAIRF